ncbi:MAG: hypothetical protein ACLFV0_07195, partial [Nitriliruptoraceae bacterium]
MAPFALLVVVAVLVLAIDAVAGPAAERAAPPATPVEVEPRAGSVVCAVGLGGPGEPPLGLPEVVAPPEEPDAEDEASEDDAGDEAAEAEDDAGPAPAE